MASLIRLSSNNPTTFSSSSSSIDRKTCSNHNNGVKFKMSLGIHPRRQLLQTSFHPPSPDLVVHKESLGFSGKKTGKNKVWESEEDRDLEDDVLEFMKTARDPESFPTKEELIIGGRLDLVKRIIKQGGWLAFGWDLDDGEEEEILKKNKKIHASNEETAAVDESKVKFLKNDSRKVKFLKNDSRIFQNRFDTLKESQPVESGDSSSLSINGSHQPSSSGRMEGEEDAGIGGILSRLQKERFRSFRVGAKGKESKLHGSGNGGEKDVTMGIAEVHGGECNRVVQSSGYDFDDSVGMHAQSEAFSNCDDSVNPVRPDMWRKWSSRRAGYSEEDFEAAEFGEDFIRNDETVAEGTTGTDKLETVVTTGDKVKDINHIRSRLRYLESELDSVRHLLGYQTDVAVPDKTSEESHSLSDSSEFRETEIMKSKDKLRSLRAKLAVLEGKMALKIVDSQRMVNGKQKRIHYARKALNSLRTHCIVWPKDASEVLLVGSFDGWTSKRKMEETSPGVFSLFIRLYPGRYEIKFIVDGEWMIDPLRPIAPHWGYANNVLIISENE